MQPILGHISSRLPESGSGNHFSHPERLSNMDWTRLLFTIGIIGKGVDSLLEIAGGVLLLTPVTVNNTIQYLLVHELLNQGRHPTIAKLQYSAAVHLSEASPWAAVYLIVHGTAKVVLIAAIFFRKRWGYVGLMWVLSIFALIEFVKGAMDASWPTIIFGVGDCILVFLIWKEYRQIPRLATIRDCSQD